ncbi:MAG: hypothetical protein SFU27_00275 [Thermonemataceae bacterium]|nr:hypothetical protein [Thermonemataceae bacterium]
MTNEEIKNNMYVLDHLFDMELGKAISRDVISLLDKTYFRSVLIGFEEQEYPQRNNPERPLIFASNHSGMAFPWDAMIFVNRIHTLTNYDKNAIRALTAPMLSASNLMNPYQIPHFWKKVGGGVDATTLNFETVMQQNDFNVMIYPEGVPGIGKGFNRKYQLQKLSTSMVRMSIKYQTDIIPFAVINGEYINPYTYSSKVLNKIVNFLGIPFLPLGFITPWIILFPWIFYMGFPAKLIFVLGKRIKPYEMTDKSFEAMDYDDFRAVADKIHEQMQKELSEAEQKYGKKPYQWREFFKEQLQNFKYFPYTLPFGWPLLFAEFERLRIKKQDLSTPLKLGWGSCLRIIFKNPKVLAYYIPILGWIPLAINGLKRVKEPKKPH